MVEDLTMSDPANLSATDQKRMDLMASAQAMVIESIEIHEQDAIGGRHICWTERLNAIAFLCHSLGLGADRLRDLPSMVAQYEARCKDPGCAHLRN
jgi:hypothetical protein